MDTYIIAGFTGSGKSEFCVNLALHLHSKLGGARTTIADLDVINPYFRSREKEASLRSVGIDVIGGALGNNTGQDVPHLDFGFVSRISAGECVVIDLAGGTTGLGVLKDVYHRLQGYEYLAVLNLFRPETCTADKILSFIDQLNAKSDLRITGFVNNSHMLRETEPQHILMSQVDILRVCEATGLPLRYTMLVRPIYEMVSTQLVSDDVLVLDGLQLREAWQ